MLKNFFISMLGALAAFWISIMLFVLIGIITVIGSIASQFANSDTTGKNIQNNSVLVIPLDKVIVERQAPVEFMSYIKNEEGSASLNDILNAIAAAKDDDRIEGIYLRCDGASAGIATRMEILNALKDFKESGKWIVAYSDAYSQGDYYIASCASKIFLNPIGMIEFHGLATAIPFYKNLFDKVGIEMQIIKVGTYKSAVEPYILTSMSDASRLQTSVFLNNIWNNMVKDMADSRQVEVESLNLFADSLGMLNAPEKLLDLNLVDELKYRNEVTDFLKNLTARDDDEDLIAIDYNDYLASADIPHQDDNKNKIAVYYAYGNIVDAGTEGISSEQMVPDILALAEDEDIAGMVLRVNSGGGSAFASEQIWHALEIFKSKGKKLYVSMGDYAASGGYYISCGAEKIYAEPVTLTGSIGIYGMIPCAKELINDKLGINFDYVTTNANGVFPTLTEPMTPFQRAKMQQTINRGYELFTSRCAAGRHLSQDSIKAIGEGRVWDGQTALSIGLVDRIGGINDAIAGLAKALKFKKYQIVEYPNPEKSFWQILSELDSQMQTRAIHNQLGTAYPIYKQIDELSKMEPIQARMPIVIIQ